jgi:uncharacterized SAM-binding protein YcdF (DUF218 family)
MEHRKKRFLCSFGWTIKKKGFLISLFGILFLLYVFHAPLLTSMANFLIVNNSLQRSDVIIVLSGGAGSRVPAGVKLFKEGYADKLIVVGGLIEWKMDEAEIMKNHAENLGVASSDIIVVKQGESTYAQARKLADLMRQKGFVSAILVTSDFHSRRSKYIFRKTFLAKNLNVKVYSIPSPGLDPSTWWTDSSSAEAILFEYMKLIWYFVGY